MAVLSEKECAYVHYSSNLAHCVLPLSLHNPGLEFFIQNSTSPRLSVTMSIACFKTLPKISPIRCVHSLQAFMLMPAYPRHNHRPQQGDFRHHTSPTRSLSLPAKTCSGIHLTDLPCITAWEALFNFVRAPLKQFGNKGRTLG